MKLLEFPHSHYCEKARWALDFKGLDFQTVPLLPGFHIITVRKYAPATSVPVLLLDNKSVQGSSEILNFLDENYPQSPLMPKDAQQQRQCLEIEHSMDEKLGENLRRILYHRLLAYPDFIRYCFTQPMPTYKKAIVALLYPVLRRKMHKQFVVSEERVEQARSDFDDTMNELADLLGQRAYLIGDTFTRADLSVASMLSLLVMPEEHPFPWREYPNPQARAFHTKYQTHPVFIWAKEIYKKHR
ncbi:MAG: glutathione S-transferase family protein [Lentisphaeraceae bacterium]|nr:glutathione S-transferase family protein [Lentisphaeraceae bacterium]